MSKRKPAKSSKRARSPAIATRAHGKKQTVIKSARDNLLRSVAAGPIESHLSFMTIQKKKLPTSRNKRLPSLRIRCKSAPARCEGLILLQRRETWWLIKRSFWK